MPEEKQPRPQISADVRRRLLMDAAMTVMKREGIAAASTRAICQEAGMAHGVFHYCFRSKYELFAALIEADFNAPWRRHGASSAQRPTPKTDSATCSPNTGPAWRRTPGISSCSQS
ncbi:TetR/AcrR family transcriptional regulator [Gordonia paraffinivorans]|uniref:TetR/AcrR family transcriptional regulator n=1 Tax=Gordonia paraffinivorans TaxID=175628 RepID=UPI00242B9B9E|nr:helix-turn-helix domain-containing protein [Gordonia paraffinivorans]